MKKLLTIAVLMLLTATAFSQNQYVSSMKVTLTGDGISGATFDTVVSTAAHYLYCTPIKSFRDALSIAATVTEINDTTAAAITLETSIDGTNWSSYYTGRDSTYTFSPADQSGSQTYRWNLYDWADSYLRIKCVGVATPNFIITAKMQAYSKR